MSLGLLNQILIVPLCQQEITHSNLKFVILPPKYNFRFSANSQAVSTFLFLVVGSVFIIRKGVTAAGIDRVESRVYVTLFFILCCLIWLAILCSIY